MSASVSQMIPTPPESMIFCKIPVPVLLPENINIRLRGISGSSAFAFSRPKELKEVISFLYLFISSATVADLVVDRLHEHSRPREHAFSGGGGSDDEGLQTGEEPFASI